MNVTIDLREENKGAECGKGYAAQNGLCLACTTKPFKTDSKSCDGIVVLGEITTMKHDDLWKYAVTSVRDTLNSRGLQAAVDHAHLWERNVAFDPVKLLAEAKGVPIGVTT